LYTLWICSHERDGGVIIDGILKILFVLAVGAVLGVIEGWDD